MTVVPKPIYQVIGNRVIIESLWSAPFGFSIGVNNVSQNKVTPVYDGIFDQYDGLEEAFYEYGCRKLIGDIDGDNEISVVEATILQRCDLHMREYPESDIIQTIGEFEDILKYYSYFNHDGERDYMDVNCVQQYLVGLPYPKAK